MYEKDGSKFIKLTQNAPECSFTGNLQIQKVCFGEINVFGHTINEKSKVPIDLTSDAKKNMVLTIKAVSTETDDQNNLAVFEVTGNFQIGNPN